MESVELPGHANHSYQPQTPLHSWLQWEQIYGLLVELRLPSKGSEREEGGVLTLFQGPLDPRLKAPWAGRYRPPRWPWNGLKGP